MKPVVPNVHRMILTCQWHPKYATCRPKYAFCRPKYATCRPKYTTCRPKYAKCRPICGTVAPSQVLSSQICNLSSQLWFCRPKYATCRPKYATNISSRPRRLHIWGEVVYLGRQITFGTTIFFFLSSHMYKKCPFRPIYTTFRPIDATFRPKCTTLSD
jgi:hypothetical protein